MTNRLLQRTDSGRPAIHSDIDPNRLIGVIDLQAGSAVHAIAGKRDEYQRVNLGVADQPAGSPVSLLNYYISLGLSQFYIADLDALRKEGNQTAMLLNLIEAGNRGVHSSDSGRIPHFWLDCGWQGIAHQPIQRDIDRLLLASNHIQMIGATESMRSLDSLRQLVAFAGADRVALGLDFQAGKFCCHEGELASWIDTSAELGVANFVTLDIAVVGTNRGSDLKLVGQLKELLGEKQQGNASIITGGGIRSATDVERLLEAGCQGCLVASSLLPDA